MTDLLIDAHFWVGVAFVAFLVLLWRVGVHKLAWDALGASGRKVQAQLDEAAALRAEAQALLADIQAQREAAEKTAREIIATAKDEAKRLSVDSKAKLEEQIVRRGELAQRKIAQAEAQAAAEVKAAAAELAAQAAEQVLAGRLAGAKSDPLVDQALGQIASKLS